MHRAGRRASKVNGREETGRTPLALCSKTQKEGWPLKPHSPQSQRAEAGCPRSPRRMAKRTSVAPSHAQGARWSARLPRSVRSSQTKAPFVRTAQYRLERTTGLVDALRAPTPRAKAFGRILKPPTGRFLDGIPPHRFEPPMCSKTKTAGVCLGCKISGADNGARTRDPHLGKVVLYQLSHVREYGGENRFEPVVRALQAPALPLGHLAIIKEARPKTGFE